jgi:hypothetical protein
MSLGARLAGCGRTSSGILGLLPSRPGHQSPDDGGLPRPPVPSARLITSSCGNRFEGPVAIARNQAFFEADEIPALLVLDELDLVVEVMPWPLTSVRQ